MAAVIWGLVADRPKALWAAGLGATAVIAQFGLGILVMGWLEQNPIYQAAQAEVTRGDLVAVVEALEGWHERRGEYPERLENLIGKPIPLTMLNIYDHSAGVIRKPRTYGYDVAADRQSYDLYAVGPDAEPGTEDDIRPILPDSLVEQSGYRP